MFPDIVVPVAKPTSALPALDVALAFMRERPAHLTVLRLLELPYPVGGTWSMGPDPQATMIYDRLRREGAQDVARIEERLTQAGVSFEAKLVECRDITVDDAAILHALHADLVVVGGTEGADTGYSLVVALMLKAGRPVLFVPAGVPPQLPPRRIVLAWKPTREAARAVHDAMPLLKAAERVDVVMVDLEDGALGELSNGELLLAHLRRHEVHAEAVPLDSRGVSIGEALQGYAEQSGAQLIVTGGYGHSRLREWVLGGATRDLLVLSGVPVLFSH